VSGSCVTISNPDSISRSETRVNPAMRSRKSTYLIELDVRKPLVVSISQRREELRLKTLQPGLEFDIFIPRLKSGIFKCISWLNGSFLWVMIGVF
jgi:hypothetical protein